MPIKLALYGTSADILKNARKELLLLSAELKLHFQISFTTKLQELIENYEKFDILAVHDTDFPNVLLDITAFVQEKSAGALAATGKRVVIGAFSAPINPEHFMTLVNQLPNQDAALDIPIAKGCKTEHPDNIIYFENINRRIHIKTMFGEYSTNLTMKSAKELTAAHSFATPYVSYLVNLGWVEQITGRDVMLKNNEAIPLSQKKAAHFRQAYYAYVSKMQ